VIDSVKSPVEGLILPGQTLTFYGSFTDADWQDTHTATWDFGDGTVVPGTLIEENIAPNSSGTITDPHSYEDSGEYMVVLTVKDNDPGVGSDSTTVLVSTAADALDYLADAFESTSDDCFKGQAPQRKNALSNKLAEVKRKLEAGDLEEAINKLINDIRSKADGHVDGKPGNDWVTDEASQEMLCLIIDELLAYLNSPLFESPASMADKPETKGPGGGAREPGVVSLSANVPNPFRSGSGTRISYSVTQAGPVEVNIFDAAGRLVARVVDQAGVGGNSIVWDGRTGDGREVPRGVYFCQVRVGRSKSLRKMLLVD
jgi:PKD repeat protein